MPAGAPSPLLRPQLRLLRQGPRAECARYELRAIRSSRLRDRCCRLLRSVLSPLALACGTLPASPTYSNLLPPSSDPHPTLIRLLCRPPQVSAWLTERASEMRARVEAIQTELSVGLVSEADETDLLEKAGQSVGALRILGALSARDAAHEVRSLRQARVEALRPAVLCAHRQRLHDAIAAEDLLSKKVKYAESLHERKLVKRVEAECTMLLRGRKYSVDESGEGRGLDDGVQHTLIEDVLDHWHADPDALSMRVAAVEEPGPLRWVLTLQILPCDLEQPNAVGYEKSLQAIAELLRMMYSEVSFAAALAQMPLPQPSASSPMPPRCRCPRLAALCLSVAAALGPQPYASAVLQPSPCHR